MICDKCKAAGYKWCIEAARDDVQGREPDELSRLRAENERLSKLLDTYSKEDGSGLVQKQEAQLDRARAILREIEGHIPEHCTEDQTLVSNFLWDDERFEEVRWETSVGTGHCLVVDEMYRALHAIPEGTPVIAIVRRRT